MTESNTEELISRVNNLQKLNDNLMKQLNDKEIESRKKANKDFVQLYKKELKQLRALTEKDPNALSILFILVEKMNKQNAIVVSQKALMQWTNKSRTTIHNAIKALEETKFIQIVKIGTSNAYVVNSTVFWQSDALTKERITTFSAQVVAIESEQEEGFIEQWKDVKLEDINNLEEY